jgi:pimeloyl-ACP methyl ester carboxylesterase
MLFNAKNGTLSMGDSTMDYIRFGKGEKTLIMLPGLGDGLITVKGKALPFAMMFAKHTKTHTVYVFSRKNHLPKGYSTLDMANDLAAAMDLLGISQADVLGVSMGGMIAQQLAIHYPQKVDKLVLAVTMARQNRIVQTVVPKWIDYAKKDDYANIFIDVAEKSYTETYLKKYRLAYPIMTRVGKPKSFDRFLVQANACLCHDVFDRLGHISCPTLVIGGERDEIVGPEASRELSGQIPGSLLQMYPDYGHAAYEEARDFYPKVMAFLNE